VILRAVAQGKEVVVVAGSIAVTEAELRARGVSGAVSWADLAGGMDTAMRDPRTWLSAATRRALADR